MYHWIVIFKTNFFSPVVVDVSQIDTIGLAPTWKQDVLNHAQFTASHDSSKSIPVLLLGNKADKLEVLDVIIFFASLSFCFHVLWSVSV